MAIDELLTHATPGTTLHLDLERGGAIEGEYVSHSARDVVIEFNGQRQGFEREQITTAYFVIVNR